MNKENGKNENYVLDSTAFLALFEDEPGAETVQKLFESAKKGEIVIFASFVSFTEIFVYYSSREGGRRSKKKNQTNEHACDDESRILTRTWSNSWQVEGNSKGLLCRYMDCSHCDFL
ncbi:MAG: PIN domain-containing protein [Deltaproteobacteria bacterium]|nr:PIN domain-containing protein [Deltaproteobacteria bacterium]